MHSTVSTGRSYYRIDNQVHRCALNGGQEEAKKDGVNARTEFALCRL